MKFTVEKNGVKSTVAEVTGADEAVAQRALVLQSVQKSVQKLEVGTLTITLTIETSQEDIDALTAFIDERRVQGEQRVNAAKAQAAQDDATKAQAAKTG